MKTKSLLVCAIALVCSGGAQTQRPTNAAADPAAGEKLFTEHCATCHAPFNAVRAPWPQTLQLMTAQNILQALETGKMQAQGATMSHEERFTLANYLGRHETATATKVNACPTDAVLKARASRWNGWGVDIENSRYQPAAMA